MSNNRPPAATSNGASPHAYFEQQRAALLQEAATSLESALQNLNKLNRSLESIIAVGNEFGSVEALWSQFETVMGKEPGATGAGDGNGDMTEGDTTMSREGQST